MMTLVIYSEILNIHQVCVADELYGILKDHFYFVELTQSSETKGGTDDYSQCPYLICSWKNHEEESRAMELARTADACVFASIHSLRFKKERLKLNKLSFEMGERWLDRGLIKLLSPRLLINQWYYYTQWYRKPLYQLCCGGFAANDYYFLRSFRKKCYKWGYFTKVEELDIEKIIQIPASDHMTILWCGRFLYWKHPELVVKLAKRLTDKGYHIKVEMYGTGEEFDKIKDLRDSLGLHDIVSLKGKVTNNQIIEAMRTSPLFVMTSDQMEGWGAVLNEAMSNGCAVVASDKIGATPYLLKDGKNGLVFESGNLDSLYSKVKNLIDHPALIRSLALQAYSDMANIWSPKSAAQSLLQLTDDLLQGKESSIMDGPCSKALPI